MFNSLLLQFAEWAGVIAVTMILALSPAFKRRPLIFKFRLREGLVSLGLFILVWGGMWAVYAYMPVPLPGAAGTDFVFALNDLERQAGIWILFSLPFILALLIRRQPLLSTGLGQRTMQASLTLGVGLALITIFLHGKVNAIIYGGINASTINYLLASLIVAFIEEFIFRGFIQLRLVGWLGEAWGWLAAAGLFVLWRLPQNLLSPSGTSLSTLALNLAVTLGMGLVLGWIMRKSGNILAPWLYHAIAIWIQVV